MDLGNKRILFIKQSSLGDIVHTLPVAHALKRHHPDCCIGWIVEQGYAGIVERDLTVDHVYPIHIPATSDPHAPRGVYGKAFIATVKTLAALKRTFMAFPFDISLDLHASFRSGVLALTNRKGTRLGFADARELNTLFQHEHVTVPEGVEHALDKNLLFCKHLQCAVAEEDFYMCTSSEDRKRASNFLHTHGVGAGQRFAYANPAARWETKFWPVQKWAQLADQLIDSGTAVVFGGSAADQKYIASITSIMKKKPIIAAGCLSLEESVALIEQAAVYVGLDSGPMHIAAMVNTPVAALFGPTHPERVGPYKVAHTILQAPGIDCLCCRQRVCSHMSCMKGITVEQVYGAVVELTGM
ncbi:glycosyltransferase family 9 protein [Desulfogranum marinum]|uniref:glycosyltransferase family 9 protein n=1 Tax=Desulfogranum marinum TaxID=453220 RepID=UPI001965841A|nr:glycosyltransferase family 9 protein [Desulfogranum marinum]MBM9512898.1 glycosyltransferase family 9 protein [Desulfogranum marinum]